MTASRSNKAELKKRIAPMLDALGNDPATVAETLTMCDLQGRRGSSTDCVVARYLQTMTEDDPGVRCIVVSVNSVRVRSASSWRFELRLPLPPAVRSFIWGFDRGRYPDLVGDPGRRPSPSFWAADADPGLVSDQSHQSDPEPEVSKVLVGTGASVTS
jgi:hypothetical protein